jgi:hypothetical protein
MRISKAWRGKPDWHDGQGDIYYAETRSKARYVCLRDVREFDSEIEFSQIIIRRDKAFDLYEPQPHRLVAELSENEKHIILHAFGADRRQHAGYRDHYCTSPGDGRLLRLAWELGLFHGPYGEDEYGYTGMWVGAFYYLTDFGKEVARSMLPTYEEAA